MASKDNLRDKPKFRKGQVVQYNQQKKKEFIERRQEMLKCFSSKELGNQPIYNLLLYTEPRWSPGYNCYIYDYEYGFCCTSEGSALETDLVCGDNSQGFKIF